MGRLASVWIPAARPQTLPAAAAPVLVGIALAVFDGAFHATAALAALVGALLIQIGTNYANDWYDVRAGADTDARLGPRRPLHEGLVGPNTMRNGVLVVFGLALLVGVYLAVRGGWPIVVLGLASLALGVLYTAGPVSLARLGLADLVVLVFFGPVAAAGTHYVQALEWSVVAAVAGLGPGLLSVALLTVNNLRDVETDRTAGRRTLAVRFGRGFAKAELATCLAGAALVPVVLLVAFGLPASTLVTSLACLLGLPALRHVLHARAGDRLLPALAASGRVLVAWALLFAGSLLLWSV